MRGEFRLLLLLSTLLTGVGGAATSCVADPTLYYASPAQALSGAASKVFNNVEPPHERTCFNSAETRERIAAHKLTEPFQALETGNLQGEALHAKLCRWQNDEYVYEIAVLRRDGHIVHVYMDAQSGRSVDR